MAGNILFDTNIVIAMVIGDPLVTSRARNAPAIFISFITLGELVYGAENSSLRAGNLAQIETVKASTTILLGDEKTAEIYGGIKANLRAKGKPIPDNDIWIAATAIQHNLTLVTRDAHFNVVVGLTVERW